MDHGDDAHDLNLAHWEALREHLDASFDPRGGVLEREVDGRHRLRRDGIALPVLHTLVAARP